MTWEPYNYNRDFAYGHGFPIMADSLDMVILRTSLYMPVCPLLLLVGGEGFCLDVCMELERRLALSHRLKVFASSGRDTVVEGLWKYSKGCESRIGCALNNKIPVLQDV
jgi:hypothetical protein